MSNHAYKLRSGFIDELLQRMNRLIESDTLAKIFGDLFSGHEAVPASGHLEAIIDSAFWTSFSKDEGNEVTVSLFYTQAEQSFDAFLFDNPIPFDVKTLVKLGAALENPRADIGVWPDENGELKIWGFKTRSENVIIANLWIQALGPGRVLITFGGKSLGALISNRAVFVDHSNLMRTIIPQLELPTDLQTDKTMNMLRYTSLLTTARAMRGHGRGGTLLVVPDSEAWRKSVDSPVPYTGGASFLESDYDVTKKPTLLAPVTDFISALIKTKEGSQREKYSKMRAQLEQQCRHIARLTAVDGALAMTFDRFVFCFGAKIIAAEGQERPATIRILKPVEGHVSSVVNFTDIGGTRHQSAALFAHAQPGSVAIVVSQDGDVTFFTTDPENNELIAVQQAELAVLYEGLGAAFWNISRVTEMELLKA
ncbi:putative sensor domain DACNV-containing protein [Desulfosediminicola flagellatus]|uniref:putative sensor domain DACNV-containing protein n=1 Tax=Desulfosediminicola flagellatus TaxID=2569541 RepID=UPI0010ADA4A2|nr:hypothetical protein [Desulfosediminicola flagellatus]